MAIGTDEANGAREKGVKSPYKKHVKLTTGVEREVSTKLDHIEDDAGAASDSVNGDEINTNENSGSETEGGEEQEEPEQVTTKSAEEIDNVKENKKDGDSSQQMASGRTRHNLPPKRTAYSATPSANTYASFHKRYRTIFAKCRELKEKCQVADVILKIIWRNKVYQMDTRKDSTMTVSSKKKTPPADGLMISRHQLQNAVAMAVKTQCMAALPFSKELVVHGVIGVTTDDESSFYLHINERVGLTSGGVEECLAGTSDLLSRAERCVQSCITEAVKLLALTGSRYSESLAMSGLVTVSRDGHRPFNIHIDDKVLGATTCVPQELIDRNLNKLVEFLYSERLNDRWYDAVPPPHKEDCAVSEQSHFPRKVELVYEDDSNSSGAEEPSKVAEEESVSSGEGEDAEKLFADFMKENPHEITDLWIQLCVNQRKQKGLLPASVDEFSPKRPKCVPASQKSGSAFSHSAAGSRVVQPSPPPPPPDAPDVPHVSPIRRRQPKPGHTIPPTHRNGSVDSAQHKKFMRLSEHVKVKKLRRRKRGPSLNSADSQTGYIYICRIENCGKQYSAYASICQHRRIFHHISNEKGDQTASSAPYAHMYDIVDNKGNYIRKSSELSGEVLQSSRRGPRSSVLPQHINKIYQCTINCCGKRYQSYSSLATHRRTRHKITSGACGIHIQNMEKTYCVLERGVDPEFEAYLVQFTQSDKPGETVESHPSQSPTEEREELAPPPDHDDEIAPPDDENNDDSDNGFGHRIPDFSIKSSSAT